ncbi:MAG: LamG-like jellyroll fold domain-containing protein [Dokdonia sp.]|jgi:hypothetical protein
MNKITLTKVMYLRLCVLLLFVFTSLSVKAQTTVFSADFSNGTGDNAWTTSTSSGSSWIRDTGGNYARVNPENNYSGFSYSDYVSPVIDFTGYSDLTLSVDIAYDTERFWDGMHIQYSIAGGAWTTLGTEASGFYNDTDVDGLFNGADGWSGQPGFSFNNVSIDLSAFDATFNGASNVRFRFVFGSDGSVNYGGARFDNFEIIDGAVATAYCTSGGVLNPSVIRRVNFNTIDNNTPIESIGYSDFTAISTNVQQSSTHDLTVQVNTNGNYYFEIKAWIDWNQDFDFTDPGEEYNLGTATNVTNGATSNSPLSITVPSGATLGNTRMRVVSYWNGTPTSCSTSFYGETEDYTINVTAAAVGPEIAVSGNGNNITDGDTGVSTTNHTNFGGTDIGNTITRTFTINNTGTTALTLTTPTLSGTGAARFSIATSPTLTVAAGNSTTFDVDFTPTALVTSNAVITFVTNDTDENPFNFAIQGTGIDPSSQVSIYCRDFESATAPWSNTTSTNGSWTRGTEATASAGASGNYLYTQRSSGVYSNDSRQVITSPVIDLTGYENLSLSVDLWYDMSSDGNTTAPTPDGFQLQFSPDSGTNWYALGNAQGYSDNWYNSEVVYNMGLTTAGSPVYINGWTNTSSGWVTASIDLHSQAFDDNANVQFRFDFRSDSGTTDVGVAIDNFCITGNPIATIADPSCGPAGIGTNLALWLRADAGTSTTANGGSISEWADQAFGTALTNATANSGQEPTYRNNAADNVNFHPVVRFDGSNSVMTGKKGFYSDEMYIVLKPSSPISYTSGAQDVFCADDYREEAPSEDVTGFEMGNTSIRFTDEAFAYNQGTRANYGIAMVSTSETITNPHIYNGRTNATNTGADLFKDGLDVGNTEVNTGTFTRIANSRYWLGRSEVFGASFAGDIMEVISYSSANSATDQQKIQSYLAMKYGITLGTNGVSLDYLDTDGNTIWDISEDAGAFNYDIAGIGRDDCSALNQKQSKSINSDGLLTFGLGDIYATNQDNPNSFTNDKDYLLWGNDNGNLSAASPIDVDMSAGIGGLTTDVDFLAIERVWKVVESGSIGTVKVSIPETALSTVITPPGNFLMFISDTPTFNPTSDYSVMYANGANLETTYDFDGTKYITFGYAPEYRFERSITFDGSQDYLEVEDALDLTGAFTISAWVRRESGSANRDILGKRDDGPWTTGYSLRLDGAGHARMVWKDASNATQAFTGATAIPVGEWHQIAVVYDGADAKIYIDGVEDAMATLNPPVAAAGQNFLIGAVDSDNPTNFFDGTIDEVRVWDGALTEAQLRFIMNQEIEADGSQVKGKIVPIYISKNDINSVSWASLEGYFPMNLFAYTNVKDESDNGLIAAIRNLDTVDNQTAPLPYISENDGSWGSASTWTNGSDGMAIPGTTALADSGTTVDWNIVRTSHNVTKSVNTTVLALQVLANEFTVDNDSKLEITHYLRLDGTIDLVGESQLVQTTDSDLESASSGSLERDQQGTADTYTYNYWSSPVSTINTAINNQVYNIFTLMRDGSDPDNPMTINTSGGLDGSPGTPISLSAYWFYKYANQPSATYSAWQYVGPYGIMNVGEGWTMKGPGSGGITDEQNYVFVGKPNNSTTADAIELTVNAGNDYLVGNPFPSALDADQFIIDNPHLDGTLLFWEHWGGGTHYLSQYQGGYARYNLSGGTPAISHPLVNQTGSGTKTPEQYIPVGQGFFVTAATTGTIDFNNGQRNFVKEGGSSIFTIADTYQTDINKASITVGEQPDDTVYDEVDERTKLRFGYTAPNGLHRQLLMTVDQATSFGYDRMYDAIIDDAQSSDMAWVIDTDIAVIQGVPNLYEQNVFPLHLQTEQEGNVEINLEGLAFAQDNLYIMLWDKLQDSFTDLRNGTFSMHLPAGVYADRFAIVFKQDGDEEETEEDPSDDDDQTDDDTSGDNDDQTNQDEERPDDTDTTGNDDNDDNDDDESDQDTDNDDNNNDQKPGDNPPQDKPRDDKEDPIFDITSNTNRQETTATISTSYQKSNRKLSVSISKATTRFTQATLYTMSGQIVKKWTVASDASQIDLPVGEVSDGAYLLGLDSSSHSHITKVLIH